MTLPVAHVKSELDDVKLDEAVCGKSRAQPAHITYIKTRESNIKDHIGLYNDTACKELNDEQFTSESLYQMKSVKQEDSDISNTYQSTRPVMNKTETLFCIDSIKTEHIDGIQSKRHDTVVMFPHVPQGNLSSSQLITDPLGLSQDKILLLENALGFLSKIENVSDDENISTSDEESGDEDVPLDINNSALNELRFKQEAMDERDVMATFDEGIANTDTNEMETRRSVDRFNEENDQENITQSAEQEKQYQCPLCPKRLVWKSSLTRHLEIKHKQTPTCRRKSRLRLETGKYDCPMCWKEFSSHQDYTIHLKSHTEKRYTCKICGDSFSQIPPLISHMRLHAAGSVGCIKTYFSCSVCQKMFSTDANLALHMQVHTGTQKFACSFCDARFSRKADLTRHKMIHTGEKPYKCSLCDKRFRASGELGRHRKVHNGAQTCKHCGKTYVRADEFRRHVAKHGVSRDDEMDQIPDSKTHVCKLCFVELSSDLYLQNHMRVHTLDRPERLKPKLNNYTKCKCDECGNNFSTLSNLSKHKRRAHPAQELAMKCDMCARVFHVRSDLENHIRTVHLNQYKYMCDHCPRGFERAREFIGHMKSTHSQEEIYIKK